MKKLAKITFGLLGGFLISLAILAGIAYVLTDAEYQVAKTVADDPSIAHIEVNSVKLHAETFGDKMNPPVVVLHGGPGNDYRMLLPLKELADEFYLIFYDQRGTGLSERVAAERITVDSYFDDLGSVIDHFAPGRNVHIIGHSWGAMLGSGFTARNPGRVDKLVLSEPGFLNPALGKEFATKLRPKSAAKFAWALGSMFFRALHVEGPDEQAWLDYIVVQIMESKESDADPTAGYYCGDDVSTGSMPFWRPGAVAAYSAQTAPTNEQGEPDIDLVAGIEKWPGTALFLAGECNRLIGQKWQEENHLPLYPRAQMTVIPGSGHTMFGERPVEVNAAIRAYLR
ncbi:MAG: alpha/beta hydrolase [Nitrospinota bacterium]|nr:alpha/beta hydrolase [Nitrospinota bacterium]